jgi:hypothetical protein
MATQLQSVSSRPLSRVAETAEALDAYQQTMDRYRKDRDKKRKKREAKKSRADRITTTEVEIDQTERELALLEAVLDGQKVELFAGMEVDFTAIRRVDRCSRKAAAAKLRKELRKKLEALRSQLDTLKARQRLHDGLPQQRQALKAELEVVMTEAVKSANSDARKRAEAILAELKALDVEEEALKKRFNID